MALRPVAHIELHDARIREISVALGGAGRLVFDHVCVFFLAQPQLFETWSAEATLQLEGVEAMEMRGAFRGDDYVTEGVVLDQRGAELEELAPDSLRRAKTLDLLFAGSGAHVRISMQAAVVVVGALIERLEDWHGPLVGQK